MSEQHQSYYVVMYDIQDPKRLRRIAKILKSHGIRVQKSVFECKLAASEVEAVKTKVTGVICDSDSVRLYPLNQQCLLTRVVLGEALYDEQPPGILVV